MGTEALWVPLAVGALSAGAQYYNGQRTANRQDNALAEQIRNQSALRQRAGQRIAQTVAETAASTPETDRQGVLQQYIDQLRAHRAAATGAFGMPVGGSQAFQQDAQQAAEGVQGYGDKVASLMARIDAPTLQRQREAFRIGDLGVDLGGIRSAANGQNFLDELRLRSVRRNPWVDAFSQLGMGYAQGRATGRVT